MKESPHFYYKFATVSIFLYKKKYTDMDQKAVFVVQFLQLREKNALAKIPKKMYNTNTLAYNDYMCAYLLISLYFKEGILTDPFDAPKPAGSLDQRPGAEKECSITGCKGLPFREMMDKRLFCMSGNKRQLLRKRRFL